MTNLEKQRTSPLSSASLASVASVSADGPMSARVRMKEPWSAFDVWLSTPIGYMMAPSMLAAKDGAHHPVGTGPFRFVERVRGEKVVTERNPNYWGTQPYLDRIIDRPMPEPAARMTALQAGEVDMIYVPHPDGIADLEILASLS